MTPPLMGGKRGRVTFRANPNAVHYSQNLGRVCRCSKGCSLGYEIGPTTDTVQTGIETDPILPSGVQSPDGRSEGRGRRAGARVQKSRVPYR